MQRNYIRNLFLTTVLSVLCFPSSVFAQHTDSLLVVQTPWNSKTIQKGIVWHQAHFSNLFNSVQEINWVEIDLKKNRGKVHLAADSTRLKTTSTFALENNAVVAINGGFFDMKNGGSVDYIKVNNQIINHTKSPSRRANAVLSIHKRKISIQQSNLHNTEESNAANILLSGPLLIEKDSIIRLRDDPFNSNRHPRTAIALTKKNKLILLVVDGRNKMAQGMNLEELAKVLKWIGAKDAMNLDGGGSSTLYIQGMTANNIVNYPTDNKKFDHDGQRKVANIIYIN